MDIVDLWGMALQFAILPFFQDFYNVSSYKRFLVTLEKGRTWKQSILLLYPLTVTDTVRSTVQEYLQNKILELFLLIYCTESATLHFFLICGHSGAP